MIFPGRVIDGTDRDWAFKTALTLYIIESQFARTVISCAMFRPVTTDEVKNNLEQTPSLYERCLNNIYAEAFVYSLNAVRLLLKKLYSPPNNAKTLIEKFDSQFVILEHIRNSAIHIEDRGRGVDRHQREIASSLLCLGIIRGKNFGSTGEDGILYEIEISEDTVLAAHKILQTLVNSYVWVS